MSSMKYKDEIEKVQNNLLFAVKRRANKLDFGRAGDIK